MDQCSPHVEFGPRMETSHNQNHAGFDNPHTNSPTSAQSPVGVPAPNSSHPHSPTTGQLRTTPNAPEVVYALPQKRGGDYEVERTVFTVTTCGDGDIFPHLDGPQL